MKLRSLVAVLATAVVLPVLASLPAGAAAAVDAPTLTVTWPEVTSFNPDVVDFSYSVDYTGEDQLYVWEQSRAATTRVAIPSSGESGFDFGTVDGSTVLSVGPCPGDACQEMAASPAIGHYRTVVLYNSSVPAVRTADDLTAPVSAAPGDLDLTAAWTLKVGTSPVVSGSSPVVLDHGSRVFDFSAASAELDNGESYRLFFSVSGTAPAYGTITSRELFYKFDYDDAVELKATLDDKTFYPVHDGYLDQSVIRLKVGERLKAVRARFLSPDGTPLKSAPIKDRRGSLSAAVSGSAIAALPEGTYTWEVYGLDFAGNESTILVPVKLSRKKVHEKTYKHTFTAASVVVNQDVGRCSTLKKLPKGALGLYSQTKCTTAADSQVITINGAYIPTSLSGSWTSLRITLNGGKAKGQRDAYAVMYYRDNKAKDKYRTQVTGTSGAHPGALVRSADNFVFHDDEADRDYLIWFTGLSEGSRYDVKSYTVEIGYDTL